LLLDLAIVMTTIGIATFSSAKSVEEFLEEADRDLYRQKHSRVLSSS
jgi:PleD family two-component response regulator